MFRLILVFAVILLGLNSCSKDDSNPCFTIEPDQPYTTQLGDCYEIQGTDISFEYQLINDIRCPSDADCVWAGLVVGTLSITNAGTTTTDEFWSGVHPADGEGYIEIDNYSIYLDSVRNIVPTTSDTIAWEDFRLDVLVIEN